MKVQRLLASFSLFLYLSVLFPLHAAIPMLYELKRDSRIRPESLAGFSVDTATGSFVLNSQLASLQGYLNLTFDITYKSLIHQDDTESYSGDLGPGWSHQYDAWLFDKKGAGVTIALNNHENLEFLLGAGEGLYVQFGYGHDVLEKITDGELAGLWRLTQLDGTIYLFDQFDGRLIAILNRHNLPILIKPGRRDSEDRGINLSISAGEREIRTFRYPTIYNLSTGVDEVTSLNRIQYIEHGDATTFLRYDSKKRMDRVYDPVRMETIAEVKTPINIPDLNESSPLEYSFNVTATGDRRLIRVRPDITHADSVWLKVVLVDPRGVQTLIHSTDYGTGTADLFLPKLSGDPQGTWKILVTDLKQDGISGTINGIKLERSTESPSFTQYQYDAKNQITRANKIKPGTGQSQVFSNVYDADGRAIFQGDGNDNSRFWSFEYKKLNVRSALETTVSSRAAISQKTVYRHDDGFNLTYFKDELDNVSEFTYDPFTGARTSATDPKGSITRFTYDTRGNLASIQEPNGAYTHFSFDEYALATVDEVPSLVGYDLRLVAVEGFLEIPTEGTSVVMIILGPEERLRIRIFDSSGDRIVDRTDIELKESELATLRTKLTPLPNDADLSLAQKASLIADAKSALPTSLSAGNRRNLTGIIDALNNKTVLKYNESNALDEIENEAGEVQYKFYDQTGNKVGILNKDGDGVVYTFKNGQATSAAPLLTEGEGVKPPEQIEYDSSGRITKIIDSAGSSTTFIYDARGNVIEKRNALNQSIKYEYNFLNQIISKTDPENNTTLFEYDKNGNLTRMTNPFLESVTYVYDDDDRLIQTTDAAGNSTRQEYDATGRVSVQIDGLGNRSYTTYDDAGNRTALYLNGQLVRKSIYNSTGLPTTQIDAKGNISTFEYDESGGLIRVIDPRGNKTELTYNELGHVIQVTDATGRKMDNLYFSDDTLRKFTDSNGNETKFEYTTENKVRKITTQTGETNLKYTANNYVSVYTPPSITRAQQYQYNAANRLVRTSFLSAGPSDPDRVYTYDKNGNRKTIGTQKTSNVAVPHIERTYDKLNRRISNTDKAGNIVFHEYNNAGLVSKVTYPGNLVVSYTYDAAKRLRTITDWLGGVTEYTWTNRSQIESIQFPNGAKRSMEYDAEGRLNSRYDFDAQGSVIVGYKYEYDQNGFISSEQVEPTPATYQPEPTSFVYGLDNRLVEQNGHPLLYDADGNVTQAPIDGTDSTLTWDLQSNLSKFKNSDDKETVFHYDVTDSLIGWDLQGGESVSLAVVDSLGGSQVMMSDSSVRGKTRYVYGVGLAYEVTGDQIKVYHYDERGNTVAFSDTSGEAAGSISYSPFGKIISETGDTNALFKFSGLYGVISTENDLNYMRFRWYSPSLNRFVSMDSQLGEIGLSTSLNRYLYAANNPINYIDPEGEFPWLIVIAVGVGAGIAIGAEAVSAELEGRPHEWQNYLSAAIGGGIAGGITAATGGGGWAVLGAAFGGAAGGASEVLSEALFRWESPDPGKLLFATSVGFVAGGALGGVGKWARNGATRKALISRTFSRPRNLIGKAERVLGKGGFSAIPKPTWGYRIGTSASGWTGDFAASFGHTTAVNKVYPDAKDEESNSEIKIQAISVSPTANVGTGGEYQHYQLYLEALEAAGLPLPNPTLDLSSF